MGTETRKERDRALREADIIAAAERIFGGKGFAAASMDEIAAEAQFTKRTVYLYFLSKEELFFAAALVAYRTLFAALREASGTGATGFEKLRDGIATYYRIYREQPGTFRLITEIGAVKKNAKADMPRLLELMRFDDELFRWIAEAVAGGKADGSIREDIDPVKTTFSVIFMMTGFFAQLSLTGDTFLAHFSLDAGEFCDYSMGLLLGSIRR